LPSPAFHAPISGAVDSAARPVIKYRRGYEREFAMPRKKENPIISDFD